MMGRVVIRQYVGVLTIRCNHKLILLMRSLTSGMVLIWILLIIGMSRRCRSHRIALIDFRLLLHLKVLRMDMTRSGCLAARSSVLLLLQFLML